MLNTISMIGLGYIGLPTATLFASRKKKVIGVDVNQHAVDTINQGRIHIVEPELDVLTHKAVVEGYLRATTVPEPADAFLIAVPTPFTDGHKPDLSYIEAAARSIAPVLAKGNIVILESTSPVGATETMARWLAEARPDLSFPQQKGEASDIRVAHCPERVLPGQVLRELVDNDRIIGGMTPKCAEAAIALYKTFVAGECIATSARTAELCKLTENSFRDVNIAFANELSMICHTLDVDVWELIGLANRHPRVNILQPGCGVGGHCIAVDPWFIIQNAPDDARLISMARQVNDFKPQWVIEKVHQAVARVEKETQDVRIVCLGLAFKPNIDDLRESPAVEITKILAESYPGQVCAVEPHITECPASLKQKNVSLKPIPAALECADVVVMLVDHTAFTAITAEQLGNAQVIDTKGLWR